MRSKGTKPTLLPIRWIVIDLTCSACALESCLSPVSDAAKKTWNEWTRSVFGGQGDDG